MRRPLPTLDEVNARLLVNPKTGIISHRRLPGRRGRVKGFQQAGTLDSSGRRSVWVNGRRLYAHRLVWFVARGEWPDTIVHRDGDLDHNAISNLYSVPRALEPRALRRLRTRSASGRLGARRLRRPVTPGLPYRAEHRNEFVGYFATAEAAEAAVVQRMTNTAPGGANA